MLSYMASRSASEISDHSGLRTTPGATTLTRIGASSTASALAAEMIAPEAAATDAPAAAAAFAVARPIPLVPPRMTTRLIVEMDIDVSRFLYGTFVRSAGGCRPTWHRKRCSGQFVAGREQALVTAVALRDGIGRLGGRRGRWRRWRAGRGVRRPAMVMHRGRLGRRGYLVPDPAGR